MGTYVFEFEYKTDYGVECKMYAVTVHENERDTMIVNRNEI